MPELMACRDEMGILKPLTGVKITGSVHMTVETAVLIDTFQELGAVLRWCSSNSVSTQNCAAGAVVEKGSAAVFVWRGQTIEEYWHCILRALSWPNGAGPDLIMGNGGDLTRLILEGYYAEKHYQLNGSLPDPQRVDDADLKVIFELLSQEILRNPRKWTEIVKKVVDVSEETSSGVYCAEHMHGQNRLLFPIIDVNRSITKSTFENLYGCRHSVLDALRRLTDVMVAGKTVMMFGYGEVGKGRSGALKTAGARCLVSEVNPIAALLAAMDGFEVRTQLLTLWILSSQGIWATLRQKSMYLLTEVEGRKKISIKNNVDRFCFPDGHGVILPAAGRVMNISCAARNPSFVMSGAFINQILAQIKLWQNRNTGKCDKRVPALSREMDEKVAELHLKHLDATLTVLYGG